MGIRNGQAPTLIDVAREAGVSLKTASRVLNGAVNVSPQKALKIQAVMAKLGYRPNELARGLKARRSAAIGMIVPNLSDPFSAVAVKAVQEVARANGYVVILASSGGYAEVERSEVESLVGRQIDGLIIAPADSRKDTFSDLIPENVPVVTFDQIVRGSEFDSVTVTNRRSAREATQHMLDHGYRKIVAVGARPWLYTCAERIAGYRDAMRRASLKPMACLVDHENLLTSQWLAAEIFQLHDPDAIFTLNWVCTMLTLRGLRELGVRLKRDIRLISFDDFELADMLIPGLSVVQQPPERLGGEAAKLLFEKLKGKISQPRRKLVLPTHLILRESCGCRA